MAMPPLSAMTAVPVGRLAPTTDPTGMVAQSGLGALAFVDQSTEGYPLTPAGIALRAASKDKDPRAVRAAAELLESHFVTLLLQEMRTSVLGEDGDALFAPSREERMFTQQLDQALGDLVAKRRELGIADLIVSQLMPEASD